MNALPPTFIQTVTGIFGAEGARYLEELPSHLKTCAERWSLTLGPHFEDLSINYVSPARLPDGTEAVLKVCAPNPEVRTEAEALRLYAGHGAVRLIDWDEDRGALLLERAVPGDPLWAADEDEAIGAAIAVMQRLFHPAPAMHPFPTVADWAAGIGRLRTTFDGETGPLPPDLVDTAEAVFADLLASETEPVVLHGDLHHGNILRADREAFLAIDPKGVVGEAAFEATAFMLNPAFDGNDPGRMRPILARRLDRFAEALGCSRERLRAWSLARAVLSACWSVEDDGDWRGAVAVAHALTVL